jgi:hypothetical protein
MGIIVSVILIIWGTTMNWISKLTLAVIVSIIFNVNDSNAKSTKVRSVQEVNFSEMNLKGTIRNPDGAYLVQKKGLKFMPLHDVQKNVDAKIRETAMYID